MARRTEGHPVLPAEVYSGLYDLGGADFADEILDQVQEGSRTIEEAEALLKMRKEEDD